MEPPTLSLPHTGPMRWLPDSALSPEGIHVTIRSDHPFVIDGFLLPAALIEYLAQAAAVSLITLPAVAKGRKLRQGVLVAIADFAVHQPVPAGTSLTLHVVHEKSFGPFTSARLEARHRQTLIAQADMTFHLTFE